MALQTFPWHDVLVYRPESGFSTTVLETYGGGEQRYSLRNKGKKTFRLGFKGSKTDVEEIWNFYVARKGAFESFTLGNPVDGKTYVVRFAEDALTYKQFSTLFYRQELSLIGFLSSDNVGGFR